MKKTIERTKSVCPVCFKQIDAAYVEENNHIYMEKNCDDHGFFSTLVWVGTDLWHAWKRPLAMAAPFAPVNGDKDCPHNCGLCMDHKQQTCCVLLEVTQKCNLHCPVCYASASNDKKPDDPGLDKIKHWYEMLMQSGGPFNIQLSGGEPTVRDDLPEIITLGKEMGFSFFQLNTNGIRLGKEPQYAQQLKEAGLNTVFMQFDGLSSTTNQLLRGQDIHLVETKKQAIQQCAMAGLGVVLVPTIKKGVNDGEIGDILRFALQNMPTVRAVHFQPMSFFGRHGEPPQNSDRITIPHILNCIQNQTENAIKVSDFSPGSAEHSHCSFHGDFVLDKNNNMQLVQKKDTGSCCCQSSQQAREFVSRKWSIRKPIAIATASPFISSIDLSSLDEFIDQMENRSLSISGMAFQDVWNLDLERLKRCYIHEVSPEGKLIPFCAYNLTSAEGRSLYRK